MMITLSSIHGLLKVQGPEAKKFLQGQLTCDLDLLSPHKQTLGAHCNPQGRVISLFRLYQTDEAYYLCMRKDMLPIAFSQLKKYALFYKATMSIENNAQIYGTLEKREIILEFDTNAAKHDNIDPLTAWKLAEINAHIPALYPETSAMFLSHELNLPALNAVSFNKGCYTGQEIIARTQYRAKLKTSLYRVQMVCDCDSTPSPGADIYYHNNDRTEVAGTLVDFCPTKNNEYVGLVVAEAVKLTNNPLFLDKNKHLLLTVE